MKEELKPCPFCGGEAQSYYIKPHKHYFVDMPDYDGGGFVECLGCTAAVCGDDEEQAKAAQVFMDNHLSFLLTPTKIAEEQ